MNLYFNCLRGRLSSNKFTGSIIKKHIISPFITYCDTHVSKELKDLETPLMRMLASKGQTHEKTVIETNFPNWIRCPYIEGKEAFLVALKYMAQKNPIIAQVPLYYVPSQYMGYLDVIRLNSTEHSVFGNYFYEVIEIKLSKKIKLEHIIQAAYYTHLIGKIQDFTPSKFYLINNEGVEKEFLYSEYEDMVKKAIAEIQQIWNNQITPQTYYSDASESYPWDNYRNQIAIDNNDVSLIPGIGKSLREKLLQAGVKTVDQMKSCSCEKLKEIKGIKSKAAVFIARAQAITAQTILTINKSIQLPKISNTAIFIDFEGIDEFFIPDELNSFIYLFGTLIISNETECFFPHHVKNPKNLNDQKNVLINFLNRIKEHPLAPIFHWGYYEKTHLRNECRKFNLSADFLEITKRFYDLRIIIEKLFAFPTFAYSLKSIAKYLGFHWTEEGMDGLNATVQYLKYYNNQNNQSIIDSLIQYNYDDLRATWRIKDWLYSYYTNKKKKKKSKQDRNGNWG